MKKLIGFILGAACAFSAATSMAATPDLSSCDEWRLACSGNYSNASRPSSNPINYVVIHKVQGSAASAASWFQNCAAGVSAHFTFNNSSGYCYQSVYEADIAYHAGNWTYNQQAVGIEHGGYVTSNDTATVCYDESALETKSCIIYYSVTHSRGRIVAHSEVPGASHTDPGAYWNWSYYMSKCNPNTTPPPPVLPTYVNDSPVASATWATSTATTDKYGANYRWHSTSAASDPAVWSINVGTAGTYRIQAWWSAGANRSATAPYILPDNSTASVNQQVNGGQWNTIGTKSLATGVRDTKLSYWTGAGFIVVADAIRYTP